jgi:hypothetical protein
MIEITSLLSGAVGWPMPRGGSGVQSLPSNVCRVSGTVFWVRNTLQSPGVWLSRGIDVEPNLDVVVNLALAIRHPEVMPIDDARTTKFDHLTARHGGRETHRHRDTEKRQISIDDVPSLRGTDGPPGFVPVNSIYGLAFVRR